MKPPLRLPLPSAVVCNTGPIVAMNSIGQLDIPGTLISSISITTVIAEELREGLQPHDQALHAWLAKANIKSPTVAADDFLAAELDAGEASVIALAKGTECCGSHG